MFFHNLQPFGYLHGCVCVCVLFFMLYLTVDYSKLHYSTLCAYYDFLLQHKLCMSVLMLALTLSASHKQHSALTWSGWLMNCTLDWWGSLARWCQSGVTDKVQKQTGGNPRPLSFHLIHPLVPSHVSSLNLTISPFAYHLSDPYPSMQHTLLSSCIPCLFFSSFFLLLPPLALLSCILFLLVLPPPPHQTIFLLVYLFHLKWLSEFLLLWSKVVWMILENEFLNSNSPPTRV